MRGWEDLSCDVTAPNSRCVNSLLEGPGSQLTRAGKMWPLGWSVKSREDLRNSILSARRG